MSKWHVPTELVDEGREHPFTQALLKELVSRHDELLARLRDTTAEGAKHSYTRPLAGRLAELHHVIRLIRNAEGNDL